MGKRLFIVLLPLALSSCLFYENLTELVPGEYTFVDEFYTMDFDNITLTVRADRMIVNDDLSVEVFLTWSTDWTYGSLDSINKPSDVNRATLFLRDTWDDEHLAVDGTGAAYGTVLFRDDLASGSLEFDPLPEGTTYLRLIDLDVWREITLVPAAVY